MSLAITAAPWRNDSQPATTTRRRNPSYTSRRTLKQTRAYPQQDDYNISPSNDDKMNMLSDLDIYSENGLYPNMGTAADATSKVANSGVNAISNMMKKLDSFDGENGLADFSPPPMPQMNQRIIRNTTATPIDAITNSAMEGFRSGGGAAAADEDDDKIPIYIPAPPTSQIAGAGNLGLYSDYTKNYEPPRGLGLFGAPTAGSGGSAPASKQHKELLEKLNYIIHMLELQQHEKTENVMEELILYSFLGIFIIFLCDCFARAK